MDREERRGEERRGGRRRRSTSDPTLCSEGGEIDLQDSAGDPSSTPTAHQRSPFKRIRADSEAGSSSVPLKGENGIPVPVDFFRGFISLASSPPCARFLRVFHAPFYWLSITSRVCTVCVCQQRLLDYLLWWSFSRLQGSLVSTFVSFT